MAMPLQMRMKRKVLGKNGVIKCLHQRLSGQIMWHQFGIISK